MPETLTSEFISSGIGSTEVRRDESSNYEAPRSEIQIGDPVKLILNDSRRSAFLTFDMGDPSVGLAIPPALCPREQSMACRHETGQGHP